MMVLIGGGLVSFWGPVLGVVLFFLARDLLGAYTETWLLWYGLLFMAVVLFKPEGIAGVAGVALRAPRMPPTRGERMTLALFEATRPAQALRRPRRPAGRRRSRSTRASCPASWVPTAPARPPASTC